MTTPDPKRTTGDRAASRQISDAAVALWLLAVLLGQFLLVCWWFAQMYST
jgi:hypothetical protein